MLNWESLQAACLSCTNCPLSQTRHNVVFGVGPRDAEVMFVGEGPGENEDLQGEPFVGAAGKFLDEMLSIIDLGRENCYITNIVKCRPPRNRDPMQTEQDACISFLRAQTKLIQPKIIGQSVGVRPIYVLLAITLGGGLFGFWGILLSVPSMAVMQMLVCDFIDYRNRKKMKNED